MNFEDLIEKTKDLLPADFRQQIEDLMDNENQLLERVRSELIPMCLKSDQLGKRLSMATDRLSQMEI